MHPLQQKCFDSAIRLQLSTSEWVRARAGGDYGWGTGLDLKWNDGAAEETGRTTVGEGVAGSASDGVDWKGRRGDEGGDGLAQILDALGSTNRNDSVTGRGTWFPNLRLS